MWQSPVQSGASSPARRSRWVLPESVRRSDLDSLQVTGRRPGPRSGRHGGDGDPRYRSPVRSRKAGAFVTDVVVHFLLAAGAMAAVAHLHPAGYPPLAAFVGTYVAASLAHRVLVQAAFQATAGKALTGLRVIRPDDGQPAGVGVLLLGWLAGVAYIALEILGNA